MNNISENSWKEKLTNEQYNVLREKGTEKPFSGEYVDHHDDGFYYCAGCGNKLFSSSNKFDSNCGWPSFDDVVSSNAVEQHEDNSLGMKRIEITCAQCGGHLGHVFPDGPKQTTELRYCVNSVALNFKPEQK
ncbi:MAG: peptide-methionine (R)-S-oxide reductase MsrB [Candidatus Nomurabacteria bacterium]|nr:peptide-methionine (R)-S-oxide reductase MsrB [Candidatus Nomurabacteria bacterium]